MNIGIDIDGVLVDEDQYIIDCTSKYCFENNIEGFTNPYACEFEKFDWSKERVEDYRNQYFNEYVEDYPARMYASEIIKKLKEEGNNIIIITARHKSYYDAEMQEKIKKWLEKNNIYYDELIFAKVPKLDEVKKYKIDLMIEDSVNTIVQLKDIVKVFCYDARYNRDLKCDNVTRVFSWYDIYSKYKKLKLTQGG